jgi:hypothetical protein
MNRKLLVLFTMALVFCLATAVFYPARAGTPDQWTQVPLDAPGNYGVTNLETFKGKLYASVFEFTNGLSVWRLKNDGTWTRVTEYGFGNSELSGTNDMISFKGMLYVTACDWLGRFTSGEMWRSANGTTWEAVTTDGFGDPNVFCLGHYAIFNDLLYVTASGPGGLEIWRSSSGAPGAWEQVVTAAGMGDQFASGTSGFIVFKGALYAVIETDWVHPARVWRTFDGVTWKVVTDDGFGDAYNVSPGGAAVFQNYLYVGMMNNLNLEMGTRVGQIYRTKDGLNWERVINNGFGDPNNVKVDSLYTYQGQLYAGTWNEDVNTGDFASGVQIWRSADGLHWTQANQSGFGDPFNWVTHLSVDVAINQGSLYYGTWNPFGGQVWKLTP